VAGAGEGEAEKETIRPFLRHRVCSRILLVCPSGHEQKSETWERSSRTEQQFSLVEPQTKANCV
jgi:hypothetical protein